MQQQHHHLVVDPSSSSNSINHDIFSILESNFLFGDHHDDAPVPTPTKVCILSIDGGGMAGILPGKSLDHLEQALRSASGDPHASISDYFDLAAGTGVGGLFAAMLFAATPDSSRPLFPAHDTWRFLTHHAQRLYRPPPATRRHGMFLRCASSLLGGGGGTSTATAAAESAMKQRFGETLTLRDTLKPVLIPCYDLLTASPLVFSRADALESPAYDFRLWEVCRATCAEPGRFEPADILSVDGATSCVGVDGGLAMSNPTAAAITHVLHNKQEFPLVRGVEDLMVLSLGCGAPASPAAGSESLDINKVRRWGAEEWARPLARIASEGAADLVDHAVALAFGQCRSSNYVRVQANGSSMGNCDASPANIKLLLEAAEEMLKQKNVESVLLGGKRIGEQTNKEKLDWIAGELVQEHRMRSSRISPTVAFKQPPPKQSPSNI